MGQASGAPYAQPTETEKHRLLVEWNDTDHDYPKDKCIHDLFEEQAAKTPDAVAVLFESQQLTYRELNVRANQLARYLREIGVGPEVLVGIYLERSLELVIALLGILKAGGAYVPLDPTYPQERVQFMIEDSRALVLLTKRALVDGGNLKAGYRLSPLVDVHTKLIYLDTVMSEVGSASQNNPNHDSRPNDLAYVIYTSGSTGRPKGVMISHGALLNHMLWMQRSFGFGAGDGIVQKTPVSFDASVWEFFAPLISGGRVILAGPQGHKDSGYLVHLIQDSGATILQVVPSMLRLLVEEPEFSKCSTLRRVFCGGEALTRDVQEQFFKRLSCPLHNLYGPTEATIDSTHWECRRDFDGSLVPIGRPIANTRIYILDAHLNPVPLSIAGELYIAGDGLARGYLNRPELTAEKFIMHAFDGEPAQRLYKSGDLGRYLPDGDIEFLGRIDDQVKIRGYRIELGEVEATLAQHPAVRDCVVVAREHTIDDSDNPKPVLSVAEVSEIQNPKSDRRLTAYVVPHERRPINELREFLEQKLPEYMVPSAFVFLPSLPLTANGKVDRRALPEPEQSRNDFDSDFAPPQTPSEEVLAGIWAELLKLDRVGIHDNFFHLGGHSLLATQVVSRICSTFKTELTLRRFFEIPTIAGIVEAIQRNGHSPVDAITPAAPTRDHLPLSFAQERLWFLDQFSPGSATYNVPLAVRLTGALDISTLEQSFNELIYRHQSLRTVFPSNSGQPSQSILPSLVLSLSVISLDDFPAAEREAVLARQLEEEARRPFDLARGPLIRVHLWRVAVSEHVLLINLHHIVCDGWSISVLWRELSALYRSSVGEAPAVLPELSIQYADYAVWQRKWLHSDRLAEQIDYWKKQLDGAPRLLDLPTDHPRPAVQTHRGRRESRSLPTGLSERVRALGRRENATLFMTLLAAFGILLHRYTGEDDIVVGTPIAGRNRQEIEGLIGFFLNHLALRIDMSGRPSFRELLDRVRDTALGAYTHHDLPFERLLEELQPQRDLSRTPLFQVYFNVLELEEPRLNLPGVEIERVALSTPLSKFDLTLYVRPDKKNIRFNLVYNPRLFSRPRMVAMLEQLEQVLSQLVDNPDIEIDQLSLVTSASRAILPNPAEEQNDDAWQGAIHERLSEQARVRPGQLALVDPWEDWSYETLDLRSNQLANYLRAGGIQSEEIVAIYGHRSAALVCAIFGILKAGAAFLILDPAYPASRNLDCLQQANPRGWLHLQAAGPLPDAVTEFTATLPPLGRIELPRTSAAIAELLNEFPVDSPGVRIGSDSLAYLSFTSGSTGRPKGVLGRHGALTHFLPWQQEALKLTASDRFSLLSGLAHDPLQRDIFTALWVGATLCIPDPDIIGTSKLASWMATEGITFAHLTPPMLNLLADTTEPGQKINSLRYVFFVGDALTDREVERSRYLSPQVTCVASYGTTETQRAVGYHVIAADGGLHEHRSKPAYPLGRGMGDAQLLVLNRARQQAGIGELGEVYVRSPHLARGYLNDDALTATKFLRNPFTKNNRDRLYRTGDLGRYLSDGTVEFAGRIDDQVKIRGYRIELGEIEAALNRYPAVRSCAVIAIEMPAADSDNPKPKIENLRSLVAYVVARADTEINSPILQRHLSTQLPEYMVPRRFVFVDALPLTPSGKLDRRALPQPDFDAQPIKQAYVAPRNALEWQLAAIWEEVLDAKRVGIHTNFFEFGGHSLNGIKVIARVRERYHIDAPVRWLFESPTIAGLAEKIQLATPERIQENGAAGQYSRSLFELKPGGSKVVFFLPGGFGADGEFLVYAKLAQRVGEDFSFYGLRPSSADGDRRGPDRVEDMAREYLREITAFDPQGPYLLVGNCIGGIVAYELARQLIAQGKQIADLILMDTICPAVYRSGSLFKRLKGRLNRFANNYYVQRAGVHKEHLRHLSFAKRLQYLWSLTKDLPGVRQYRRNQESYIRTLEQYCPQPYNGSISMIVSERISHRDPTLGWSRFVSSKMAIYKVRGDHEGYIRDYVTDTAKQLRECLMHAVDASNGSKIAP